jgi:hypothetical protein
MYVARRADDGNAAEEYFSTAHLAEVAQSVEHFHGKEGVGGSNPLLGSRSHNARYSTVKRKEKIHVERKISTE